jgi:ketosteroid isomerase-like protein
MEALTESLRAAELSFAASVADDDFEGFKAHIDDAAIFVAGPVLNGRTAIAEAWSGFFGENAPKMEWHPETVVVRPGGNLGISNGPYTLTMTNADGTESTQKGYFTSVWEHQPAGGWKIIFDSGCPPCPDCASP